MAKGKHITLEERDTILIEIKKGTSLKDIANKIGKDPTSVSKEIRKHRYIKQMKRGDYIHPYCYICFKNKDCKKTKVCSTSCMYECRRCSIQDPTKICRDFVVKTCPRITRFPYACNGCLKSGACRLDHYYYDPKLAQEEYKDILVSSRSGIDCTEESFHKLDEIISDGVKKGKSIYSILLNHPDINVSERTVYRYITNRYLQVKDHDLRNKVKMKPRKEYKYRDKEKQEIQAIRDGRTYEDYLKFLASNRQVYIPQLDLVIGKASDSQYLMTLIFPFSNFMLGILVPNKEASSIVTAFNYIQDKIGIDNFKLIFPAILTDRGREFIKAEEIEYDINGEFRTKVFYCDAYTSSQKAEIERNHELFRYFFPRGQSLNNVTQDDINLIFSHINSYNRESKGGKTPYEIFEFIFGNKILDSLNIKKIPFDEVNLTKSLIKKIKK